MNKNIAKFGTFYIVSFVALIPQDAFAYLDPASLSMFAQILVAGVVGGFMFFKGGLNSVKNLCQKIFKKSQKP